VSECSRLKTLASAPVVNRSLRTLGHELETDEHSFGWLGDSSAIPNDPVDLNQRMDENGYLYIKGFFPREIILEARKALKALIKTLARDGIFEEGQPLIDGILKEGVHSQFNTTTWKNQPAINRIVFGPEVHQSYNGFHGGAIRHFDDIWLRTMGCGHGTPPHCDIVYMSRGTHRLYTDWIPYGEVPIEVGGFMILEKSHLQADRIC